MYKLAQYATQKIKTDDSLELCIEPESMNVCFQVIGKSSDKICDALDKKGLIKVGHGTFREQIYIRLVCVNAALEPADIDYFFNRVKEVARDI